jgi:hypothetical protein
METKMQTRTNTAEPKKLTPRDRRLANRASRHQTRRELAGTRNIRYTLIVEGAK